MTLKHPWETTATETSIAAITYKKHEKGNHLKRGLSVVTIPTSNSDGLKSADNTEDKQLMAVCKDKKQPNKIIKNFFSYTLTQLFSNHIFGDFEALKMDEYSRVNPTTTIARPAEQEHVSIQYASSRSALSKIG